MYRDDVSSVEKRENRNHDDFSLPLDEHRVENI